MLPECLCSLSLPSPSRWYAKDSYGRGDGLATTVKDAIFKQPYLPVVRLPPSSTIKGSDPAPPETTGANPTQCGVQDCISHMGCFVDMAGGVRAVPTGGLRLVWPKLRNAGWTPLLCAAEAKLNGATIFAIQASAWALCS